MYVADRLIDAVCEIDYPQELLEIQVLDDSTDETTGDRRAGRAASRRARLRHPLPPPRRSPRLQGRRARGRAEEGVGPLHRDLRRRLRAAERLPAAHARRYFEQDAKVGMVQARWGHINRDYSLLTRIQSILLDAHFVLEHGGRNRAGCFFNFNGTAGVWRRDAIDRRRRLAARHADRGPRPQLSRAAQGLALRVPARPRVAGRSAGRDELVQVAAAPLGEGLDPDLPEAAAAHPALEPAARASRPKRSSTCRRTSTTC